MMVKYSILCIILSTMIGCDKNQLGEGPFETEYASIKGTWVDVYDAGKFIVEFKEDNLFYLEYEFSYLHDSFTGNYSIHSKDSLMINLYGTDRYYPFNIDLNNHLEIHNLFGSPRLNVFQKAEKCDVDCNLNKTKKIIGNWKIVNNYYCDTCKFILSFNENDSVYKIKDDVDTLERYGFKVYPENYFSKTRKNFSSYFNYFLKSDTLYIEERGRGFESYLDTTVHIRI